jgi:hypothetical protein
VKLIERLAAAYRAGELPDYMLEFVDSLRTRPKQPTFWAAVALRAKYPPVPKILGLQQRIAKCVLSSDF